MHKQLNEVMSGKQKQSPLSNPIRLFAQDFIDGIANDSTVSPEKRWLLHAHLSKYVHQIHYTCKDESIQNQRNTNVNHERRLLPSKNHNR